MKKTLLIVFAMFCFGYANAQMKLGNNPTTTNSNAVLEMETTNKGLLLPRVALTNTTAFAPLTAHVAGMAIYNTATAGDVTPGYYFNDGAKWVRVVDANAAATNLYAADGTLTGNRTVTMGANNLSFMGTGNVGIGTTTPHAALQLGNSVGNRRFVLYESTNNDHQFYGLGITANILRYQVDDLFGNHVFYAGTSSTTSNELMRIKGNGNVGIGTATPSAKLEVIGTTKTDALQVVTGAGAGKILTSDAVGVASWTAPKDVAGVITKLIVSPNSGATGGNIPCTAGYDIIRYESADGNYAATITLPVGCTNGQRIQISSGSTFTATIAKTNTNALGTTKLKTGDYYEFVFNNGKWSPSFIPTRRATFCSTNSIQAPTTPLSIVDFYDGCWNSPVTMPVGTVGDEYIIWDTATFNVTIDPLGGQPNITLVTGNFAKLIYTTGGWVRVF